MASLTPKVIGGHTYYYARECQRVDGKPRIVKTAYLGSLDHILEALSQAKTPLQPKSARLASFGDVAALYDQAQQIGLVELIDAQVPKRDQGLSTGQYLLLAASTAPPIPPARLNWPIGTTTPFCRACCPPPPTNSPAKPSGTTWSESPRRTSGPLSRPSPSGSSTNSSSHCACWCMTAPTSSLLSTPAPQLACRPAAITSSTAATCAKSAWACW